MDNKENPAARMNGQNEMERFTDTPYKRRENVNGSDFDDWLKAERIVAEWLKDQVEAEDTENAQKKQTGM